MQTDQDAPVGMTPMQVNDLILYARELDSLIPNTDAAWETWGTSLSHVPFEAGKKIIRDYYGKHSEPHRRDPISPAHIRKIHRSELDRQQASRHQIEPPNANKMPRHILLRFQKLGILPDRDPDDFPERRS